MEKETLPPRNNFMDTSVADEDASRDTVSARRRRLIRASATAVPVILTLRSGAAIAAVSMDCRDNDANRAAANPPDSVLGDLTGEPAHDEWLRMFAKTGERVVAKVGNTDKVFYLVETTSSTFDYFDSSGNKIDDIPSNSNVINSINNKNQSTHVDCYYVDKNGWECTVDEGIVGGCNVSSCTESLPPGSALTTALGTNNYKEVQLLVSVSWSADGQTAYLTYYPQMPVANDYNGAPITDSCWCSVSPDFTPQG